MRIVVDMQGIQSASSLRGIGRYTDEWLRGLYQHGHDHEIVLLFNGLYPASILKTLRTIEGLTGSQPDFRIWTPAAGSSYDSADQMNRVVSLELRATSIRALQPDLVHVTSLFEGFDEPIVTDVSSLVGIAPVTTVLFDLIPLTHHSMYLDHRPMYRDFYKFGLSEMLAATQIFAISDFVREEALEHLGILPRQILTIGTASNPDRFRRALENADATELLERTGVTRPFVLCAGGGDFRKNLRNLVRAYSLLTPDHQNELQFVFAGALNSAEQETIRAQAMESGLDSSRLVFTGYVSDAELGQLYTSCLVYVFPSLMEGFGLPALEAMNLGVPVIASHSGNLRDLVSLPEALFDPNNPNEIARVLTRAIEDETFRDRLRANGLEQSFRFSWDLTARRTIDAWERVSGAPAQTKSVDDSHFAATVYRPKLAFVSPFPPDKTGIAAYAAELLPALIEGYDIILISDDVEAHREYADSLGCDIQDDTWLKHHQGAVDRVVYQFGNSQHHAFMFPLIQSVPGVVVLHDLFLGDVKAWMSSLPHSRLSLCETVYESHGIWAVNELNEQVELAIRTYPVNFDLLRKSLAVVTHSQFAAELLHSQYALDDSVLVEVVPLVRSGFGVSAKAAARARLGLPENEFIVASFGFVTENKATDRLLRAWKTSGLDIERDCRLLLCGEVLAEEPFASAFELQLQGVSTAQLTGFLTEEQYQDYLEACDVAIQLRSSSRGESSKTILDVMTAGKPVIINAIAANAEFANEVAVVLAEEYSNDALASAIVDLRNDPVSRQQLGERAQVFVQTNHNPTVAAQAYHGVIERSYQTAEARLYQLERRLGMLGVFDGASRNALEQVALAMSRTLPPCEPAPRLLLDLTGTIAFDHRTGIQRVARAIALDLIENAPAGYRVELVYLSNAGGSWHYRAAKRYMLELLGLPLTQLGDRAIQTTASDVVLTLDISGVTLVNAAQAGVFDDIQVRGGRVFGVVFDLLPIESPEFFPPGTYFEPWIQELTKFDGVACISAHVAERYLRYARSQEGYRDRQIVGSFPLGSDIMATSATTDMPEDLVELQAWISERPTFLMVGTIEPRKGHLQMLQVFDALWSNDVDVNLLVIGQEGWTGVAPELRRTIPEIVETLQSHPRRGSKMRWKNNASDALLADAYDRSDALVAASFDEGFGLPLIEAARHGIPILARDIPVFREVAGSGAFYFRDGTPEQIAEDIQNWLALSSAGTAPTSDTVTAMSWSESRRKLLECLGLDAVPQDRARLNPHAFLGVSRP